LTVSAGRDKADDMHTWLRTCRDRQPVSYDERTGMWNVFRYQDVHEALTDTATFSSDFSAFVPQREELAIILAGNFARMDPPRHQQLRGLVSQAFTRRFVAELTPHIERRTAALLDAVRGRGTFDLVGDFAHPLPLGVITELLGVPAENEALFGEFSEAVLLNNGIESFLDDQAVTDARPVLREMSEYLRDHIRRHRASPGDSLIDRLIAAEIDGEVLADEEIIGFAVLMLVAGHVTTAAMLGNTVLCLHENPGAVQELRADPDLLPGVIEEAMRYRPAFTWGARVTTRDVRLSGCEVPAKSMVAVWLASANRDETVFDSPDVFDPRRSPNVHLTLGKGIHFCLGAQLARLEMRIALRQLLDRYAEIAVLTDQVTLHTPESIQAARCIPVQVTAAGLTTGQPR
jgi:cytochrome P450